MKKITVEQMLAEVQTNRITARTVTVAEIEKTLLKIEQNFGITKKALNGTTITVDINFCKKFPQSYKGIPESTIFKATYVKNKFVVTEIKRSRTQTNLCNVILSDTAKIAILDNYKKI